MYEETTVTNSPFYNDPQFILLFQQYETSLRAFQMAVNEALRLMTNEMLPGPRRQLDPAAPAGPPNEQFNWDPDWNPLNKVMRLRRNLENDAYRVFSYRKHISHPLPPETINRELKGLLKDASGSQLFGKAERSFREMEKIRSALDNHCRQVWKRYVLEEEPKSAQMNQAVMHAYSLVAETGLQVESAKPMEAVVNRFAAKMQKPVTAH